MEHYTLYFGALQLNIDSEWPVNWRPEERRFFTPALPTRRTASVTVRVTDALPTPTSRCIRRTNSLAIFRGTAEERIYSPGFLSPQRPFVYSRRTPGTAQVEVQALADLTVWRNPNFLLLTTIHLESLLLDTSAMVLHSCYTEYQGEAILFTAPSGTGKTTHATLWKRIYGSTIVNGDRCLLQRTEEGFRASGFFIHGSADECENRSLPLKAIVIIRQSPDNRVEKIPDARKAGLLYSEITSNAWDTLSVLSTLDLLEQLIRQVPVVILHCNMEDDAAHTLHRCLYGEA